MIIKGDFKTINEEIISVSFWAASHSNVSIEIGGDDIKFTTEPVIIESNCEDTFQRTIIKNCTINLLTKIYLGDYLFSELGEVKVSVKNKTKDTILFAGYVEPQVFTQPYAHEYESLTINCIDTLGLLQYITYSENRYEDYKSTAELKSFRDVLLYLFNAKLNILDETGEGVKQITPIYLYDNNKISLKVDIFNTRISENLFLGETVDDEKTKQEVLDDILTYFNLHCIQEGEFIYLFDWDTIRNGGNVWMLDLKEDYIGPTGLVTTRTLSVEDYGSDDTTISISEVYNKLILNCKRTTVDSLFESPLESEYLTSPYDNKQYYMGEYSVDKIRHWFFRYKESQLWDFNYLDYDNGTPKLTNINSLVEYNDNNIAEKQYKILQHLKATPFSAALLSFGKIEEEQSSIFDRQTWDVTNCLGQPKMSDYLVISVNGNADEQKLADIVGLSADNENVNDLENVRGLIEYKTNMNMVFSPANASITNYLVFSGSILYAPLLKHHPTKDNILASITLYDSYEVKDGKINRFVEVLRNLPNSTNVLYPFNFWGHTYNEPTCLLPPIDELPETLQYNYNADHSQTDNIDKIAVLQCVLKIGDKYLRELETPKLVWPDATTEQPLKYYVEDYEWTTEFSTFSLGFDPKIGDFIIGKKYDLLNNVSTSSGLEETGMMIPIRATDNLAGKVEFKILGPYNSIFENTTKKVKRKAIFWKKTSWTTEDVQILSKVQAIFIDKFECKFVTDNGKIDLLQDADLIYYSDENKNYINVKDDITFNINSALTLDESREIGVNNLVSLSNPIDTNNLPITVMKQDGQKAEHKYIEQYFNEYSNPKILLDTTLRQASSKIGMGAVFKKWFVPYMNKTFITLSSSYDVYNDKINIHTKEQ